MMLNQKRIDTEIEINIKSLNLRLVITQESESIKTFSKGYKLNWSEVFVIKKAKGTTTWSCLELKE